MTVAAVAVLLLPLLLLPFAAVSTVIPTAFKLTVFAANPRTIVLSQDFVRKEDASYTPPQQEPPRVSVFFVFVVFG